MSNLNEHHDHEIFQIATNKYLLKKVVHFVLRFVLSVSELVENVSVRLKLNLFIFFCNNLICLSFYCTVNYLFFLSIFFSLLVERKKNAFTRKLFFNHFFPKFQLKTFKRLKKNVDDISVFTLLFLFFRES